MLSGHTRRPREPWAGGGGLRIIGDWALEAHLAEKNHHRCYQVTVGCDLLDAWTVAIRYGRTGQGGRELRYASPRAEEMRAVIRDRLRLSAPRRIGCPYRLAPFSAAPGFDASFWLPGEIMTRFFQATSAPFHPPVPTGRNPDSSGQSEPGYAIIPNVADQP
jgi:hypothetical protein